MVPIEIVFTKSKKKFPIGSWLIRWWTKQPYSHVAKRLPRRDWGHGYYQANDGKVNYEHEDVFHTHHIIVKEYKIKVEAELELAIRKSCWKETGKKYALMQNLGIFLVDVLKIIGIKINNPWKDGRNCSELLYVNVFKQMIPGLQFDENKIKPHEIEQIVLEHFIEQDGFWYIRG